MLYVSADDHVAREVIAAFEAEHDLRVLVVGDTEASKTTGLVERLRAEADAPQADVFWSSEIFMTIPLADEGILAEHLSDATVEWPADARDGARRWFAFGARARVIAFDPERVAREDVPDTWLGLTQDRWRGRIVMADPRFGTTGGHLGAMRVYWNERLGLGPYYEAFIEGLADNETRLLPSGNAGVVDAVARGEADLGLTDTDDVWAARERGWSLDLVYPRHHVNDVEGTGTLLIPNTVARVAGGPNPEGAAILIDFILSERVERLLAESTSHNIPLRPGLADEYPQWQPPSRLEIDYAQAAAQREDAVNEAIARLSADRDDS